VTSPTEAALTLNGIAWNRDSADRLAIINGQPAGVGENVAGAVVVEILQDRARFTRNGKTFELSIGKSSVKE
jgi:general secretion pathway protein B